MVNYTEGYKKPDTQSGIKLGNGLILINVISVILIVVFVFIPSSIIRPILAVPFLMIFPGYTLLAAIFPGREQISGMERLVVGIALSIALAVLLGLYLNYSPWGIEIESVLYSLSALIFLNSTIAWLRQIRLPKSQRFCFELDLSWFKQPKSLTNSLITTILVIAILGALSYTIHVSMKPKVVESYSEFYILDQQDGLGNYPQILAVGDEGSANIAIVNHEGQTVSYSIMVGPDAKSIGPIILSDGQQWKEQISFLASSPGQDQKIEFYLYRDGDNSPYRKLHLMIDVIL